MSDGKGTPKEMDIMQEAERFLSAVLPKDAGEIQKEETLKAFIAGFVAASLFHSGPLTELDDQEALNVLDDLHRQIDCIGKNWEQDADIAAPTIN